MSEYSFISFIFSNLEEIIYGNAKEKQGTQKSSGRIVKINIRTQRLRYSPHKVASNKASNTPKSWNTIELKIAIDNLTVLYKITSGLSAIDSSIEWQCQ